MGIDGTEVGPGRKSDRHEGSEVGNSLSYLRLSRKDAGLEPQKEPHQHGHLGRLLKENAAKKALMWGWRNDCTPGYLLHRRA